MTFGLYFMYIYIFIFYKYFIHMYLLTCLNLFVTFSSEWHATDAGKAYHQNYRQ